MHRRMILTLSAYTALTVLSYGSFIHVRAGGPQTPLQVEAAENTCSSTAKAFTISGSMSSTWTRQSQSFSHAALASL